MEFDPWTADQEAAALAFCHLFEGTPHMQRRLKPGRGADCVRFTCGVLQAAGMLPDFRWPSYPQNIGHSQPRNWLAGVFLEYAHSQAIATDVWIPQTGDVGIFKVGRTSNHVGIVVAGRFWHVTTTRAVHDSMIDAVRPSLQEVIRLTAAGLRADVQNIKAK